MIDLTRPIRRKSLNPDIEGHRVSRITTNATFHVTHDDGTWTVFGSIEDLERSYENIPEKTTPQEYWIDIIKMQAYPACRSFSGLPPGCIRVIEWPEGVPLPELPT